MKIDICEVAKATEKGLTIEDYIILLIKNDGCDYLFPNYSLNSNQLLLNNYEGKNGITEKGKAILKEIEGNVSKKVDSKYTLLHKTLQDELVRLTSKKQAKANGEYTFLCNEIDLHNKLSKCMTKYKLKDWEKIEKLLILHVNKAYKQNFNKVLLVQYYIEKNGMSTLASDYENYSEIDQKKQENNNYDGVNI